MTDSAIPSAAPGQAAPPRSAGRTLVRTLLSDRKALAGGIILLLAAAIALLAPVIAPGDPNDFVGRPNQPPSAAYWFGTTASGQDVLAQTVWGSRISLSAGVLVGVLTTALGTLVGMTAGYLRGRTDDLLSLVVNVFLIMPSLPLLIVLAAFLPPGHATIVLVLTVTGWAWPARVLRAQTLALREKDFVIAAEMLGETRLRIVFVEILPNMLSIVAASFVGSVVYGIGAQAGLEFIGLGDTSAVSWGTNLYWAANNSSLLTGAWWTFVPSGACIAIVAFAFSLLNYAIDELTNPRLRSQRGLRRALRRRRRG